MGKVFDFMFKSPTAAPVIENDYKSQYESLIKQAEKLLETASMRNFTTLDVFDPENDEYLQKLAEIIDDRRFLFFMHRLTMGELAKIIDGTPEAAQIGQGVLKGIDRVMLELHACRSRYHAKQSERQIGQ